MNRFWVRVGVAIGVIALVLGPGWPGAADPPPTRPPEDLKIPPPEPRPTDIFPRLDSALAHLALSLRNRPGLDIAFEAERAAIGLQADGSIRVIVEAEAGRGAELEQQLRADGYLVETRFEDLVQVRLGPERLAGLAEFPGVRLVRRPYEPIPDAITSEGVSVIRADLWQGANILGQGVRVGVLDLGFYGYSGLLGSELPATVVVRSFRADGDITGGGEKHGTAVAEIIHDIAPAAGLYLANFGTEVEWANAIEWLVGQGVHVVNHSAGKPWCPADGKHWFARMVDWADQNGVLWVNSAGNPARSHWWGSYWDPDYDLWLNFSSGDEVNNLTGFWPAGTQVVAWLCWDDLREPYRPIYDYDLYLVARDLFGNVTVLGPPCASVNWQATFWQPFEWFGCSVPYNAYYGLAVRCFSANCSPLTRLHLFVQHRFELEYYTEARSLLPPADAFGSFTVGAVRWDELGLEPYSSRGPTEDGRTKPDIAAPTRVSTSSYGYRGFAGTSASAPHAAGAAALVKAAFPQWGPSEIRAFLEGRARDLGPAGKDNAYGSGALDLGLPVPLPPSGLVATAVSPTQVNLAWTDNSNNESLFSIERRLYPAGSYARVGTVGPDTTVFQDAAVNPATTYSYRVQACSASGCSGYSNEAIVSTPGLVIHRLWLPAMVRR